MLYLEKMNSLGEVRSYFTVSLYAMEMRTLIVPGPKLLSAPSAPVGKAWHE